MIADRRESMTCSHRGMRMGSLERESYGKPKERFSMFACRLPLTSRCDHRHRNRGNCLVSERASR